jgi:hypothetical protein
MAWFSLSEAQMKTKRNIDLLLPGWMQEGGTGCAMWIEAPWTPKSMVGI